MPGPKDFADAPLYRLIDAFGNESDTFRALRTEAGMLISDGRVFGIEAFTRTAVRCSDAGEMVVRVSDSLSLQDVALSRSKARGDVGADAHFDDVKEMRAAMGPAEESENRADLHLHDAMRSGLRDHAMPQHVLEAEAVARAEEMLLRWEGEPAEDAFEMNPVEVATPDKVLARIQKDVGISPNLWVEVKKYPSYQAIEQTRAMARAMLAPILGNTATLEDLRRLEISNGEVERFNAVRRWVKESGEEKTLPPFRHPAMPGYVTSEVTFAEMNGVSMLIFSDFNASYAYAWQSTPDMAPKIDEDAEPEGPSFLPRG